MTTKPKCPECNDTGIVWFDVDTPGTPHYCGGCSGYPGIRHEPACGTETCPNGCPVVPTRWVPRQGDLISAMTGITIAVVYCRSCKQEWLDGGECACTCADPAQTGYEDWIVGANPEGMQS